MNQETESPTLKKLAICCNKCFSEIDIKMAANIKNLDQINGCTSSFFLKPITLTEVMTYIHNLNPSKSSGPDEISLKCIKMSKEIIAPILVELTIV